MSHTANSIAATSDELLTTDTPIVEVPRTVNVVTQDQITEQQLQSVREALGYRPGVSAECLQPRRRDLVTITRQVLGRSTTCAS
jgi:outer membrane receptor for ferric coprogen and ferric-rhodotorulic acid